MGPSADPPGAGPPSADEADVEPPRADPPDVPAPPMFRARARIVRTTPGTRRFEASEVRDVPGTFGDPFRTIESMPGVVPVASGVPLFFVRGAPPAGSLYVYDGIPIPLLFHLGLGPAVVHPRMMGDLRLHAGGAPARYGRMVGAVIAADAPSDRVTRSAAQLELRLLDVSGAFEVPLEDGGELRGAVRWGWPALLAGVIVPGTELFYGDYQLRASVPISDVDRIEVVALGAYDRLTSVVPELRTELQFHRLELRLIRTLDRFEIGAAIRAAYDRSNVDGTSTFSDPLSPTTIGIEAGSITPRLWTTWRERPWRVSTGAELTASFGRPDARLRSLPSVPLEVDGVFAESITRSITSAWIEVGVDPDRAVSIELGGRLDLWMTGDRIEGSIDPRVRVVARPIPELALHVGGGVARQPASFYLPVPGLSEVSLSRGLQTAIQGEVGGRVTVAPFEGELTLFVHHYDGIVFSDAFVLNEAGANLCARPGAGCVTLDLEPRTSGLAWGGEVLLRVAPDQPLTGWISYTLAWVELEPVLGLPYRAPWDVRHVLSVVARWEVLSGLTIGARAFLRSGAPHGMFWVSERDRMLHRHTQELDAFFRADAQVAYAWNAGWGRLRLSLEWLNVTIAEEPLQLDCALSGPVDGRCPVYDAVPIFAPNIGLRVEI